MKYFKFILSTLVIVSLVAGATGCRSIKKAVDASARLAAQVKNLQEQTEKSYDQKLVSADFARDATKLIKDKLNPSVGAYIDFVEELKAAYPAGTKAKPTAVQWAKLRSLFKAVTSAFAEVAAIYKLLTPEQSVLVSLLITALQETLDVIGGAVSLVDEHIENGGAAWLKLQTS